MSKAISSILLFYFLFVSTASEAQLQVTLKGKVSPEGVGVYYIQTEYRKVLLNFPMQDYNMLDLFHRAGFGHEIVVTGKVDGFESGYPRIFVSYLDVPGLPDVQAPPPAAPPPNVIAQNSQPQLANSLQGDREAIKKKRPSSIKKITQLAT